MTAAEQQRSGSGYAKRAFRVYHSHSRSRELLALPLTPAKSSHLRAFGSRRYQKSYTPNLRLARILILMMAAFAAVTTLRKASPPDVSSFAKDLEQHIVDRILVLEQPTEQLTTGRKAVDASASIYKAFFAKESSGKVLDSGNPGNNSLVEESSEASENGRKDDKQINFDHDGPENGGNEAEEPRIEFLSERRAPIQANKDNEMAVAKEREAETAEPPEGVSRSQPDISSVQPKEELREGIKPDVETAAHLAIKEEEDSSDDADFRNPADSSTFSENTALNYFHMHKTGGVSFKMRLFDFFNLRPKKNRKGLAPRVVDTCHMSGKARPALGIEAQWSCDWGEIEVMPEKERTAIDVIVGHQYWERGAGYWLPNRDLRCFTVMRHPLHRKVSFFYHFFVRNAGRSEDSVTYNELIQFILGKEMPDSPLVRDAGPSYYASRLWSDGISGYDNENNRFIVPEGSAGDMVYNSIRRLRRNFVFVGLQNQETASLCMLRKTVEKLAEAHEFDNMDGLAELEKQQTRLNTGSYALSAELIWDRMSQAQQQEFKRIERVDLAIYREGRNMFDEMVKTFECEHLVVDIEGDDIAL